MASVQDSTSLFKRNSQLLNQIDRTFTWVAKVCAFFAAGMLLWIAVTVAMQAAPAIGKYGLGFLFSSVWNPAEEQEQYGAFVQIYGTIVSSLLSLFIAVPFGFGGAIFLSEDFVPARIRLFIAIVIELLAAIPSVVFGIWGLFVFIPATRPIQDFLHNSLGWFPLFGSVPTGNSLLTCGIVLGIMVTPIVIAISREVLLAVPPELRSGALAMGATRWEALFGVVIPAALGGMMGAVVLGLGRAMGETMAAAMLIGNSRRFNGSILAPSSSIPALMANEFGEATDERRAALMYCGFILLILTLGVNILAEFIVTQVQQRLTASK